MKILTVLALFGGILLGVLPIQAQTTPHTCNSPIYCPGPLLQKVQLAQLYPDSKTFVDKPTSKPLADVLSAFAALPENATVADIKAFVDANFLPEGLELVPATLTDFKKHPKFLDNISDKYLKGFADQIHGYWPDLTRQVNESFLCSGCVSSFLPASRSFVIPGGRFREFYYWDTYFVLQGLLLSELYETSKNMILNFLDFVDTYGFMPNGARIYYLNRSQPPFLVQMVKTYYEATKDTELLARALPTLDAEYAFWQRNTSLDVTDPSTGKTYRLNHYNVQNNAPRPESYLEDYNTVANGTGFNLTHQASLYADLATGAETGWDYSSRWVAENVPNEGTGTLSSDVLLQYLQTRDIVPVELNSLMYANEMTLSDFHKMKACGGDRGRSEWYKRLAKDRLRAMEELLWDEASNTFQDWDIVKGARRSQFTPSNYYPYWVGALPPSLARNITKLKNAFTDIDTQLQKYPGVITTTTVNSGLQWDFPDGWPPLQFILINALRSVSDRLNALTCGSSSSKHLREMAFTIAQRFVSSAYCGWVETGGSIPGLLPRIANTNDTGHMFEKYNVTSIGVPGGGGEYEVQVGFGWTNGVALWTLNTYGNKLVVPTQAVCES